MLAAQTAAEAKAKGDFSAKTLFDYQKKLEASMVMPDLQVTTSDIEPKIEQNMDLLTVYPEMASRALYEYFTVDGRKKKDIQKSIFRRIRKTRSIVRIVKDFWNVRKAF